MYNHWKSTNKWLLVVHVYVIMCLTPKSAIDLHGAKFQMISEKKAKHIYPRKARQENVLRLFRTIKVWYIMFFYGLKRTCK